MKKVLVFATTFPTFLPGDATPGFVYELSHRLAQQGLDITVLTPRVPWAKKYEEKNGLKIHRFPYFFISKLEKVNDGSIMPNIKKNKLLLFQVPFLLIASLYFLHKHCKKWNIQLIHAHWVIPQTFIAVIYKKVFNKNIKILSTSHWSDINSLDNRVFNSLKAFCLRNVDLVSVVSSDLKEKVIKLWANKKITHTISMWVDQNTFSPNFYDESIRKEYNITWKFFLFVGRLSPEKGIFTLIEAMYLLKEKIDFTLLIIWHWPLEQELKKRILNLWLTKNILFLGKVQNSLLPKYYSTADFFVSPSISEWLPVTYIEAILSWSTLIGTSLPWNKDIIIEWRTGYMIEVWDHKALAKKIITLQDKTLNNLTARKIIIDKFSWEIIVKRHFNIINEIKCLSKI